MTPTPSQAAEKAIREALEAGPTPGPWHAGGNLKCTIYDRFGQRIANSFEGVPVKQRSDAECQANALLNAACNPEAMTTLLDAFTAKDAQLAELRAEVERLREDSRRLDHLQDRGATVEVLLDGSWWKFRIGGLLSTESPNIRYAIDTAALVADRKDGAHGNA